MHVFEASYRRWKAWACLHCMRNMHVGLMMGWGLRPGNRASPPASATVVRAQGGWSDHTEPQILDFWDSPRADPQLPMQSCLPCPGCFFFSHHYWAHGSLINFTGAVAEYTVFPIKISFHTRFCLLSWCWSTSLHIRLEQPCHFVFSLGSSLGFKHIQT